MEKEEYKENVFHVLTKQVPKELFMKLSKDFLQLCDQIENNPHLLDMSDFFEEDTSYEIEDSADVQLCSAV